VKDFSDLSSRAASRRGSVLPPWPLLAPALACVLLDAHFFRAQQTALSAAMFTRVALQMPPLPWAAHVVQAGLALGALEWLRAAAVSIAARLSAGQLYLRLALILGAVTLFTAAGLLVLRWARVRRYRGLA
jgi:hypothetical protein